MADPALRSAGKPAPIHSLEVATLFDKLDEREKLYAHHMSRASWHGTRIILRQTSPEAGVIFDLIMSMHELCNGNWVQLASDIAIDEAEMNAFLDYAACFLSNIGNYYGSGDQKFVPKIKHETLEKLCDGRISSEVQHAIMAVPPFILGFSGKEAQSAYYPGPIHLDREEIATISRVVEQRKLFPENTRLRKDNDANGEATYTVLQASVNGGCQAQQLSQGSPETKIWLEKDDHTEELASICEELKHASKYAANENQQWSIGFYIKSFETGDLEHYRNGLRSWVRDISPKVEHILGLWSHTEIRMAFELSLKDWWQLLIQKRPRCFRSSLHIPIFSFEGYPGVAVTKRTVAKDHSRNLCSSLQTFVAYMVSAGKETLRQWLIQTVLAYCSSIIFPGINLPNYNDIRQDYGFKNVIIANRMSAESSSLLPSPFVDAAEAETFQKHKFPTYYIWVVLHELLGHGTGKMMCQHADGSFNFDRSNPPAAPLSGRPIQQWYLPGQTWTGQFEDLATTVDECRAELVGAYLMDDKELLALFDFTDSSDITAADLTYNIYMQLAVDGLRGLQNFNPESHTLGQAHSRAHFATLKCLLRDSKG